MAELPEITLRAWTRLVKAQRILLERVEADLKKAGLPPLAWYDVLLELYRAPGGCLRQFEIGERILLSKYNLSRLLDRMAQEQVIARATAAADRRGSDITITAKGNRVLKKMWPPYRAAIERDFAGLFSEHELEQLTQWLGRITG